MSCRLTVKVVPGASRNKVVGMLGEALKIRVQAPPEKGKANAAVLKLVAQFLDLPAKQLSICAGHTSATKVVEIQGISEEELAGKLAELAT
ncbi:DUF167 domain-containing protein [Kineobactrum salinum]|uniref:UPF0235 protein G3T16_19740 n=1 Tax=Kineobactrum salinum TaxID=2708301 RepID=A0A6C0U5S5_9GAMM|nr:DUF167 domain-containing protein [Kineobactrum salinum]QIB67298.1 DUF167 domain-containing protein [Kineobactrum salinum]